MRTNYRAWVNGELEAWNVRSRFEELIDCECLCIPFDTFNNYPLATKFPESKLICNSQFPNRLWRAGRSSERRASEQISQRHPDRSTEDVQEKAAQNDGHRHAADAGQASVRLGQRC